MVFSIVTPHSDVTTWPSETLVSYNITVQCHNPEYHNLNLHWCENLKSHIRYTWFRSWSSRLWDSSDVAMWSSEVLVSYHITALCHNPEYYNLNLHRYENLKSCITHIWWLCRPREGKELLETKIQATVPTRGTQKNVRPDKVFCTWHYKCHANLCQAMLSNLHHFAITLN